MKRILFIFGTRPEAIKLSPVLRHMRSRPDEFHVAVCVTAQHRAMLDQVLSIFQVVPDYDLDAMRPAQSLSQSTSRIVSSLEPVIERERPDLVIVQGDTTSTFCGALAAFYFGVPVGHVEAGLRTGDLSSPFPEEMNRVLTTRVATLHFAPTKTAADTLRAEGVPAERIFITGNSGIDAVLFVRRALGTGALQGCSWSQLDATKRLILVTAHRRENFGSGFERICRALATLACRDDVQLVYPVHRNPNVVEPVHRALDHHANIVLLDPLDYVSFVDLMCRAYFVITDSGGIQEEGPSLGKPVLVMRDKTERPEAVEAGTVKVVGTDEERIVTEATTLLDDRAQYLLMSRAHNPYGDGHSSQYIAEAVLGYVSSR